MSEIKGNCPEITIYGFTIKNIIDDLPSKGDFRQRKLKAITHIVIHHSASPAGKFTPYDFARWHMEGSMKAPRVCYHYSIDQGGIIYKCNKHSSIVWHASNANYYSLGVELDGNFMTEKPTVLQMESLRFLIKELEKELNKDLKLVGHKEVDATLCPGDNMMAIKSEWRTLNS